MPDSLKKPKFPPPPHPYRRREPLPWHQPKSIEEEPKAQERIKSILESPGYRQADQDVDFLNRDEIRGIRLQLDYLKAELLLEQHSVRDTIVVFGGTRIRETAAVQREIDALRASRAADPTDTGVTRRLEIAERLLAKSHYYDVAREFGSLVSSHRHDLVIMTGGGPGTASGLIAGGAPALPLAAGFAVAAPLPFARRRLARLRAARRARRTPRAPGGPVIAARGGEGRLE